MAKGSVAKDVITKKILETFDGAFINDKEIRIPILENGETVQIKVALTCAKVNIENGAGGAVEAPAGVSPVAAPITENEVKEVNDLITKLGL